jgi:hypothetical protein
MRAISECTSDALAGTVPIHNFQRLILLPINQTYLCLRHGFCMEDPNTPSTTPRDDYDMLPTHIFCSHHPHTNAFDRNLGA